MKKNTTRIYILVLAFSLCITTMSAVLFIHKSADYLTSEINSKIARNAEKNAFEVSAHLNHMVGLVDSILANVKTEIDVDMLEGQQKEAYVKSFVTEQGQFIKNCLETSNNAHSLYLVMEPNLTEYPVESWFKTDSDGNVTELFVDPKKKKEDLTDESKENMAYFFKAKDDREKGVWTGLYFDDDLNENLFSYSRSIYIDGRFIGVVGSDIIADDTKKLMEELKEYEDGNAAIFDKDFTYVVMPQTDKEETDALASALKENIEGSSGLIDYSVGSDEYVAGYATMENGWIVATTQPYHEVYKPIENANIVMTGVAVFVGLLLTIFMVFLSSYFMRRETALEKENMEKDILLSYQFRRANVGEMVGNIAHQWKQPLNTINLILANLMDSFRYGELDENTLKSNVAKIENITDKMASTISDFSGFLKPAEGRAEVFNVKECIDSVTALMEESLAKNKVQIVTVCDENMTGYGFGNELGHVIFNVLDNARDAVVAAGKSEKKIVIKASKVNEKIAISVTDNGCGISAETIKKAFEPYYTTKGSEGTGLGLYISRNIIERRMGGSISIKRVEEGTCCVIYIPEKIKWSEGEI